MIVASESVSPSGLCSLSGSEVSTHLLLRTPEAGATCSVSTRTWRSWDAAGKIPQPIRIGRKVFWRPEELRAWVDAGCPDRVTWEAIRES